LLFAPGIESFFGALQGEAESAARGSEFQTKKITAYVVEGKIFSSKETDKRLIY
jgi:hypothetical protein